MILAVLLHAAQPPGGDSGSISDLLIQWLVALGISGVLTAGLGAWFSRRKTAADARASQAGGDGAWATAAATLTGSALSLIEPYKAQIERQELQIERQDHSLEEARQQIRELALRIDRLEADRERSQRRETELTDQLADTRSEPTELRTWAQAAWSLIARAGLDMQAPPQRRPPNERPPSDQETP